MHGYKTKRGETEVLVVGAGPTGLMTAGELARRGVAVRIVEKAPERSPLSKALVIHARTLETMDLIGLSDEFVRRGYPAPGLNVGIDSGKKPISVEMQGLDIRFPYMLVLPQEETEEILEARLGEHGVTIERDAEFVDVERHDDRSVVSRVRFSGGREEWISSRYLVGCDGAHSAVRRAIKLPFEGKQQGSVAFLGDVKIDSEFVKSRITNFPSQRGFVSVLPFLGEYSRVFAVDFTKQDRTPDEELTLADLQDTVDAIAPTKLPMREPRWLTRFRSPSRQVPTNRLGRVFLTGDAAHAHSPAGGQGMNTGLQDAFNLGWKLAMVLRGEAPGELLESYDAERHPVDARVQHATDLMFRSFVVRNPSLKTARNLAARVLVPLPPVQKRLAANLSGVGIRYRFTDRSREARSHEVPKGAVQAGDRVPDLELWDVQQPFVRLYELLRQPGYALFAFVSATRLGADREHLVTLVRSVSEGHGGALRPRVVLDEGVPEAVDAEVPTLIDFKGQFRGKLGAEHGSVLLMRPDGYVAFHRKGFDPRALSVTLASWVGRPPVWNPPLKEVGRS
ncbi:MAG: FAD-dependent monooxygenase [Actinobacteria bacterium]|nr:FAD-dependent monooxygenase [Actinomycetota bacterium]